MEDRARVGCWSCALCMLPQLHIDSRSEKDEDIVNGSRNLTHCISCDFICVFLVKLYYYLIIILLSSISLLF